MAMDAQPQTSATEAQPQVNQGAGPNPSRSPLADVRVIEVANWVAAPAATAMMADMGAEVIKIEPLAGDSVRNMMRPARHPNGDGYFDAVFDVNNRGKQSVAIALDTPEGQALAHSLIAEADVFVCNLLPRRQARFGLDAETLLGIRPRLVHATLTGYGPVGPDAERPGYDVTAFFGRGSITDAMTDPGGTAPTPRPAQGDHTTSLALLSGVLAALRHAERTGEGQIVNTSLLASATWTMASELAPILIDGRAPAKRDRRHKTTVLANHFRCGDGLWIVLNMIEERWWEPFCRAVGIERFLDDPRCVDVRTRFEHMSEIIDELDAHFATKSRAQWGEILDAHGLIWGPASTMVELTQDPQAEANGLYAEVEHPEIGRYRTVAPPIAISGAEIAPQGPAPRIGQHTESLLQRMGLSDADIAKLRDSGAIG